MEPVHFVASSLMGRIFYTCYRLNPRRGVRELFTVQGDKRLALRVARHRGYRWEPLAGLIA